MSVSKRALEEAARMETANIYSRLQYEAHRSPAPAGDLVALIDAICPPRPTRANFGPPKRAAARRAMEKPPEKKPPAKKPTDTWPGRAA